MIEHLTASLRDEATATDARASMMREAWIARMVQFGAVPILIASLLLMLHFYDTIGLQWSGAWVCVVFNLLLSFVCLSLTLTKWFTRNWRPVSLVLLIAVVVSNTGIGTLGNEPMLLYISLILLMVGTGSILPWSRRFQVSFNLVCLASWVIESVWAPQTDATGLYKMAGLLTAAALSWFTCYARDSFVTAHEKSNQTIKESEGALRQIFDANTDCISLIDRETRRILDVNEQFIRLSGFRRDELIGETTDDLNVWPDPKVEEEFMRRIVTDGRVTNMEANLRTKDGRIVPCLLSSVIVVIRGRTYVMTLTRDVTELRKSQEKLRESEEKFRLIFEASRDSIMLTRAADVRILEVNEYFVRLSGYTPEEAIGRTPIDLGLWAVPEQRATFVSALSKYGYIEGFEMAMRTHSGKVVPVLMSAVTVKIAGEDCYLGMVRDISGIKEVEQKIRDSEATLRRIFDASLDWMSIIDLTTGNYLDVNESFCRAHGLPREEIIGSSFFKLGRWPDEKQWKHFVKHLILTGEVRNQRVTFRMNDGADVPCLISAVRCELWGKQCCIATTRDITDLNEAQEKVRRSEETFRKIFDASLDSMSITDVEKGCYLDVNPEFVRVSGFTREEIIGNSSDELGLWANPEQRESFERGLREKSEVRNMQTESRLKDGSIISCLTSGVLAEIGGKLCCLGVSRDITEIKAAEQKLRQSETMFRAIFDNSLDSISLLDLKTQTLIEVNSEHCRSMGFSREEIIGKTYDELLPAHDPVRQQELVVALMQGREVRNFDITFANRYGRIFPALVSASVIEIEGRFCCLTVARDISVIKEAEEKLRRSEAMLRAIFDNSLDSISLLDLSTQTLVEVNAELTRVIGYSREEMIGKTFDDLVPAADPVRQEQLAVALMQGREVRNFEITFSTKHGRNFPALLSASVFMIGERPYTLAVSRDITDLVAAREAALAASKAKSEFLSIMSHEIRTPMNAILGMADLMGESNLNSEQRRYLDTILSNGNALLELINSILDLAKVESGRLSLETVELDLVELTERVADTLAVRAHEKGVELAVRFAPDLPPLLMGDPHRLRQILTNLIGNAIKFTKQGEVVVKVGRNHDREVPGSLLFEVHDTGIGIAPDKIGNIFSIFTQADSSTTRKFGGSGLGLAIVQRLVGLMGGRVWVESEFGTGSTFFFTADLKAPSLEDARAPSLADDPHLRGLRVLVAEENATSRDIVADMLRAKGCVVAEAASAADALAALADASRQGVHFGLLLIDAEMKSCEGYEALRRIRSLEPNAPVVVLTNSNGLPAKLRRMREQGVRHYRIKPVKQRDLYGAIAEAMAKSAPPRTLLQAPRATLAPSAASQKITDRPLRILLADDSPDNRLLIRAYTKRTPYILTEAENGQIAVERFVDATYDLVLMDIQMPVLDGYSAVRAIRKWELEKGRNRTPIIALTASALEEDVRRAKEAGCDVHVSKPVKKSTLLESIAHAIEAASEAAAIHKIDGNGTSPIPPVAASSLPTDPAALDADFEI